MVLTDDSAKADYPILQETHDYPFGLAMPGISFSKEASPNKYLFNSGSELNTDFDISLYETPNRGYDAQLGRFWQQDDLPFRFNNPANFNAPMVLLTGASIMAPEL